MSSLAIQKTDGKPIRPRPTQPRPPQKPAALLPVTVEFDWLTKPILPCEILRNGAAGMLLINGVPYMVLPLGELPDQGPPIVRGWRLTKSDGTVYDIDGTSWKCDCGDATFRGERPGGCKHSRGVLKALAAIGLEDDPDLWAYKGPSHDHGIPF